MTELDRKRGRAKPRTAVVIVHGMGSQRPRETLRGLVEALWRTDPEVRKKGAEQIWIKPAASTDLFDLATVTTKPVDVGGVKRAFVFHEFYWAHHLGDTKPVAVLLWAFSLLRKGLPRREGDRVLTASWIAGAAILSLLIMSAVVLFLTLALHVAGVTGALWDGSTGPSARAGVIVVALLTSFAVMWVAGGKRGMVALAWTFAGVFALPFLASVLVSIFCSNSWPTIEVFADCLWTPAARWPVLASFGFLAVYALADGLFLTPYFGDVARYMRSSPANVMAREAIQADGVGLLERLHAGGRYDRIVVVAHSLGTVVAYDVLKAAFARAAKRLAATDLLQRDSFKAVDTCATLPKDPSAEQVDAWRREWRKKVRSLSRDAATVVDGQGDDGRPVPIWLVSDFVSLGSPLAHGEFLMTAGADWARSRDDFRAMRHERALPCCPPMMLADERLLTYTDEVTKEIGIDHASMFGFVRWTNLFFRAGWGLATDFIGGPVAERDGLGKGVEDVRLGRKVASADTWLAHTWYWHVEGCDPDAEHLAELRAAADLADRCDDPHRASAGSAASA